MGHVTCVTLGQALSHLPPLCSLPCLPGTLPWLDSQVGVTAQLRCSMPVPRNCLRLRPSHLSSSAGDPSKDLHILLPHHIVPSSSSTLGMRPSSRLFVMPSSGSAALQPGWGPGPVPQTRPPSRVFYLTSGYVRALVFVFRCRENQIRRYPAKSRHRASRTAHTAFAEAALQPVSRCPAGPVCRAPGCTGQRLVFGESWGVKK